MTYIKNTSIAKNELGYDAWGKPKVVKDNSLFHGLFTYNVPNTVWQEYFNNSPLIAFSNASSKDGKLHLESGSTSNDVTNLHTFRNPRYEPNRGHLYSISAFLPSPTALGNRRFGFFTAESGAFFELTSSELYAVIRTTINSVVTEDRYLIGTISNLLAKGIDLSKGQLYDIQMQWRGVGSYKFFINLEVVKEVDYVNTLTELTTFNPANPLAFECTNLGDNVVIECGCVDVTSEGGKSNGKVYSSVGITTEQGESNFTGFNQPIIAVRNKKVFDGLINTRDALALIANFYADEKCICRIILK